MVEWNPVEGLEEIEFEDIQVGDTIRTYCNHNGFESCVQHVVIDLERTLTKYRFSSPSVREILHLISDEPKFCLVSRPAPKEPEGLGDVVVITRNNPKGSLAEEVKMFIRVRSVARDYGTKPWSDDSNSRSYAWNEILAELKNVPNARLVISKATYKEEK